MLTKLSIEALREGLRSKKFSHLEVIKAYYEKYVQHKALNMAITEYWPQAEKQAREYDEQNTKNDDRKLAGIPIAIKDMFLVKNTVTTAASKVLADFVAPYDAFVIEKLNSQGYIMPFKTNMDEFAMGSAGITSAYGAAINPWILQDRVARVPGGSSSGSAAAVAAHLCVGALGTDTGGSIRQPASFCGVVGVKPSYGRCSRRGVIAFGSSLDHPGVFSRSVQDACIILESMAGYDPGEATSLNQEVPKLSETKADVKGKKIGIVFEAFDHLNDEYKKHLNNLLENLKKEGAVLEEMHLPSFELALKLYFIIAPAEAASNLARYDGIRFGARGEGKTFEEILENTRHLFGTEVKRRILIGNFVLFSAEYEKFFGKAIALRAQIKREMDELFNNYDAILLPTTISTAFPIGSTRSAWEMYKEDLYTVLGNIYGGPAMSVPLCKVQIDVPADKGDEALNVLPTQSGLPIGIQVMCKYADEKTMMEVAKKIEQIADWKGLEGCAD